MLKPFIFFIALLSFAPLVVAEDSASSDKQPTSQKVYITDSLYIYMLAGAGKNFRILGSVNAGTELDFLEQDFYGKSYALELGAYREIDTDANFILIPRLKLNMINEKNIYDSDVELDGTTSFNASTVYVELAVPFIFNPGVISNSNTQFFVEPSLANKYGTTHVGIKFGFLFN